MTHVECPQQECVQAIIANKFSKKAKFEVLYTNAMQQQVQHPVKKLIILM